MTAFVVSRPEASLTLEGLRAFLEPELARYKQPRRLEFVDAIPRNPTGKVLRHMLIAKLGRDSL